MRTCSVEGCSLGSRCRGMCNAHYLRFLRYGEPLAGVAIQKRNVPIADRFWSKVEKTDGCWLWRGAIDGKGYGNFKLGKRVEYAHRVAYSIANGWTMSWDGYSSKTNVCHTCDNPGCVRPDHLFLGTHSDNMRDAEAKGRRTHHSGEQHWSRFKPERYARGDRSGMRTHPSSVPRGDRNGNAKLSDADAVVILERLRKGELQKLLAREFGVSTSLISMMALGRIRRHLSIGAKTDEREAVAA